MMNKKRTREIGRTKYLMFLPLAALLMIISNIEVVARTTKQIAAEVIEAADNEMKQPTAIEISTGIPQVEQEKKTAHKNDSIPKDDVFQVVEEMPEFPDGGMAGLMRYLGKNIKYPAEAQKAGTQGRIILQIIVDKEGNVANPKIVQGVDPLLDAEAIRLASTMPKWKPGTQKGQPANVKYTLPIVFRLQ